MADLKGSKRANEALKKAKQVTKPKPLPPPKKGNKPRG